MSREYSAEARGSGLASVMVLVEFVLAALSLPEILLLEPKLTKTFPPPVVDTSFVIVVLDLKLK